MTVPEFKKWLAKRIQEVDSWLADGLDEQEVYETCRYWLSEVEREATAAGVDGAIEPCQVGGEFISAKKTRQILAKCMAAIPEPILDSLSPPQIARKHQISAETVRNWIRSGKLNAANIAKDGKQVRNKVKCEDWDSFWETLQQEKKQTSKPKKREPETLVKRYRAD